MHNAWCYISIIQCVLARECVVLNQYTLQILFGLTSNMHTTLMLLRPWCELTKKLLTSNVNSGRGCRDVNERVDERWTWTQVKKARRKTKWMLLIEMAQTPNIMKKSFVRSFCNVNNRLMWNNQQNNIIVHTNLTILYTWTIKLS